MLLNKHRNRVLQYNSCYIQGTWLGQAYAKDGPRCGMFPSSLDTCCTPTKVPHETLSPTFHKFARVFFEPLGNSARS